MANASHSGGPDPEAEARNRSRSLADRIAEAKRDTLVSEASANFRQREMTGMGRAFRFAAEFVAAILVGAGIGYGIDLLLGTRPWAMIVLLLLGFAAGVLNVMRAAAELNADASVGTASEGALPDDDDD
ncbi:MAG: AtpZ/AtpI family protein [Hyphomicrobiaceae bacterium]|nr:AtpZ/AtpI family protein [Hyphomicrobiaceae bacterium]MCC0023049.1 AtpZ/AtpI family protein [Hyphomicrobiaceae bacterium]